MTDDINIIFEGYREVLKTIKNHESIVKELGYPREKCHLLDSKIEIANKLGKGQSAKVFSITFPDIGERKYAIKKGYMELESESMLATSIDSELYDRDLTWQDIEPFQTKSTLKAYYKNYYENVDVVFPPKLCILDEDETFKAIPKDKKDKIIVKKGSYLCDHEWFSEYVNGVYVGQLFRNMECINFFNMYSMFLCPTNDETIFEQFIIMDQLDGELPGCQRCMKLDRINLMGKDKYIDAIYIQTLFAIAMYQDRFKISHNDLHEGNVFIEYVTSDTIFNNKRLNDAKWYHYKIKDKDIYFPATGIIAKIGDFGLSVKYSDPIVGDKQVFETGYDQYDGMGPWIPNQFIPSYDSFFFTCRYARKINNVINQKEIGGLMSSCLKFMCGTEEEWKDRSDLLIPLVKDDWIHKDTIRPNLKKLYNIKGALDVLVSGPIYQKYSNVPSSGKIVTLGTL